MEEGPANESESGPPPEFWRDRKKRRKRSLEKPTSFFRMRQQSWSALLLLFAIFSTVDARFAVEMQVERQELHGERGLQTETYISEAFECDELNEEIEAPVPKQLGDSIRICIQPIRITQERGVAIRGIDRFQFEKQGDEENADGEPLQQEVVKRGGREGDNTIISCVKGSYMCVIITSLMDQLFFLGGSVVASGIVLMEFTSEEFVTAEPQPNTRLRRRTQAADILYAGTWEVKMTFDVIRGDVKIQDEEGLDSWWDNLPLAARNAMFAMSAIVLVGFVVGLAFCCFWLWKYGKSNRREGIPFCPDPMSMKCLSFLILQSQNRF
jgi:hypothetical protein